ncbi:MAG: 16S rRNA (adenine(1518)-N(6)/adenine(1519)-N(6))-dimethyltransferase RsmA [Lachnospiraceae bacterium]|nr:16S rRNA (adenine(1518)-N(6)/adenine(1519)-N(6))-dimethyltransferase RsmA [Lachnospiraceae bacterium]MBQ5485223.1 16S rRNA (adenine(1518)-N(6)/adenine(1519)-N(6))-dimethyltransferase RsmA [Lachnospiraceae bacterium]MEE3354838.1 16S rRNA (adenine(1518)-N(6)/adenine(1519)-N(6))-dimethyltransferase RsmA [Candidatus Weimeria sp.]
MPTLDNIAATKAILAKYNFHFQKKFGQNFLIDRSVLSGIVEAGNVGPEDFVVEIGPGIGTMTQYLAESAGQVLAVEIDDKLIPVLQETLGDYDNASVLHQDVLTVDFARIAEERHAGKPLKFVANLPYYITTPIIMQLLQNQVPFTSITVMVQKEVAERMQARPGSKDYGALSVAVQYYTDPHLDFIVGKGSFIPQPKVDSAVITLSPKAEALEPQVKPEHMFTVVRAVFNQRRKTLLNALANGGVLGGDKEAITEAIREAGFEPTLRGEGLDLDGFARLTAALYHS